MQYLELQWHVLTMQYTRKMQNSIVFLHQVLQIFKWKIFASSCGLLQKRMYRTHNNIETITYSK